jgi:hypothetical protein
MKKLVIGSIASILVIVLGILFYMSPYLAAKKIGNAFEEKDTQFLSQHIDFSSVSGGLKKDLKTIMDFYPTSSEEEKAMKEAQISTMQNMLDMYITADQLNNLFEISKKMEGGTNKNTLDRYKNLSEEIKKSMTCSFNYENFSTVNLICYSTDFIYITLPIILKRDGLFDWKISSFKLLPNTKIINEIKEMIPTNPTFQP